MALMQTGLGSQPLPKSPSDKRHYDIVQAVIERAANLEKNNSFKKIPFTSLVPQAIS